MGGGDHQRFGAAASSEATGEGSEAGEVVEGGHGSVGAAAARGWIDGFFFRGEWVFFRKIKCTSYIIG